MDFLDHKNGMNKDNFYFKAKTELIDKIIKDLNYKNRIKILSVGCGLGEEIEALNKYGKVYIIDINKKALDLIPKKCYKQKKVMDARNLKFKDNYFDLICALDVIEHIKEDELVVKEFKRVLKKKGNVIVTVPSFNSLYSSHDKALGHIKRYNKKEIEILFKDFTKYKITFWNSILFLPISIIRIIKKHKIETTENPDNFNFNKRINNILLKILRLENKAIEKNIKLPVGLTLLGIFKK